MLNRILISEKCNGVLIEMPNLDDLANPYCDIHLRWRRFKYLVEKKH